MEHQLRITFSSGKSKDQLLVYKFSSISLQCNPEFSSLFSCYLENVHPPFLGGSLPFISLYHASQPFTCMSQGISQDTCSIKTLLKVVEGAAKGVKLLFRGHFHINATDKIGVGHWMRRWEVYASGNFLSPSLPSWLSLLLSLGLYRISIVLILLFSSSRRSLLSSLTLLGLDWAN